MSDFKLLYDFSDWEFSDDNEEGLAFLAFQQSLEDARRRLLKRAFAEGKWEMCASEEKDGKVTVSLYNNDMEIATQTVDMYQWGG